MYQYNYDLSQLNGQVSDEDKNGRAGRTAFVGLKMPRTPSIILRVVYRRLPVGPISYARTSEILPSIGPTYYQILVGPALALGPSYCTWYHIGW